MADERRYVSMRYAARILGVSYNTVRAYVKRGTVPFIQPGGPNGMVLIPRDWLETRVKEGGHGGEA